MHFNLKWEKENINTILTNVRRKSVDGKWGKHSNCIYSRRKYYDYIGNVGYFSVFLFFVKVEEWEMKYW